jgi:NADH-quinone oxidoreductase subunit H
MVEYSGMSFAMFFLAEYANMILISMLATLMFLGGWSAPLALLEFHPWLDLAGYQDLLGRFDLHLGTRFFPRYRYDQIMRLGWKIFIPLTVVYLVIVADVDANPLEYLEVVTFE